MSSNLTGEWSLAQTTSRKIVLTPVMAGAILFSALSAGLFLCMAYQLNSPPVARFDQFCFRRLDACRCPFVTSVFLVITFMGTGSFLIPAYLLLAILAVRRGRRRVPRLIAIVALSSLVLGWICKPLFHRDRPLYPLVAGAGGSSFPSGHALGGFTFSFLLLFLVWQSGKSPFIKTSLSGLCILFGLLVAASRVYLHVHFASDVMGSGLASLAWTLSLLLVLSWFTGKEKQPWQD